MTLEDLTLLEEKAKKEEISNNELLMVVIDLYKSSSKHLKEIKTKIDGYATSIKKINEEIELINKLSSISYMAQITIDDED